MWQLVGLLQLFYIRDHRGFSFKYLLVGILFVITTVAVSEVIPRWQGWLPRRFLKQGATAIVYLVFAVPYLVSFALRRPYQDIVREEKDLAEEENKPDNIMRQVRSSMAGFVRKMMGSKLETTGKQQLRSSVINVRPKHEENNVATTGDPTDTSCRTETSEIRGPENYSSSIYGRSTSTCSRWWFLCCCCCRKKEPSSQQQTGAISQAARLQSIGSKLDLNPFKDQRYMVLKFRRTVVLTLSIVLPMVLYLLFILFVLLFQDWAEDVAVVRFLLGGALSFIGFALRGVFNEWLFAYALREANFLCCKCRRTDIWDWNVNFSASPFLALFFEMISKLFVLSVTPVSQNTWVFWLLLLFKCLGIYVINVAWAFPVTQRFFPDTPSHFVWERAKRYPTSGGNAREARISVNDLLNNSNRGTFSKNQAEEDLRSSREMETTNFSRPEEDESLDDNQEEVERETKKKRAFSFSEERVRRSSHKPTPKRLSVQASRGLQSLDTSPDKVRELFNFRRAQRRMSHRDSVAAVQALLDAGWMPNHQQRRASSNSSSEGNSEDSSDEDSSPRYRGEDSPQNGAIAGASDNRVSPQQWGRQRQKKKSIPMTLQITSDSSPRRQFTADDDDDLPDDLTEEYLDEPETNEYRRDETGSNFSGTPSSWEGGLSPILSDFAGKDGSSSRFQPRTREGWEDGGYSENDHTELENLEGKVPDNGNDEEEKDYLGFKTVTVHEDEDEVILKQRIHALRRRYQPKTALYMETQKYPKWIVERTQRLFVQIFAEIGATVSYIIFAVVYRHNFMQNGDLFPLGRLSEDDFHTALVQNSYAILLFVAVFLGCFFLLRSMYGVNIFKTGADLFASPRYAVAFSMLVLVTLVLQEHFLIDPAGAEMKN